MNESSHAEKSPGTGLGALFAMLSANLAVLSVSVFTWLLSFSDSLFLLFLDNIISQMSRERKGDYTKL